MNTEQARYNMIEQQIRPWQVLDAGVLALLAAVRRENFVPPVHRALAFVDTEVPLPEGQVMLAPKVEARLLQELQVQRHETVLEIGTGSGFMAALLAHRARQVITVEIRPALVQLATSNLKRAAIDDVDVRQGDASTMRWNEAPFDAILLSGSVHEVPRTLLEQLRDGGRLIAIEGEEPVMRAALYTRSGSGYARRELFDTVAPRLSGYGEPPRFQF